MYEENDDEDEADFIGEDEESLSEFSRISGIDLNPLSWLGTAAQGALGASFSKLRSETQDEAAQAEKALKAWKIKQSILKEQAKEQAKEERKVKTQRQVRRVVFKARSTWDKVRPYALPVGAGIAGIAVALKFIKR